MKLLSLYPNHETLIANIPRRRWDVSVCENIPEVHYDFRPYDAEIEFLQNTGTSYIDLDYICKNETSVEVKFQYVTVKNQSYIFSNRQAWDAIFALYINGSGKIAYSPKTQQTYINTNITPNTSIHTVKISPCTGSGTFYYDTTLKTFTSGTRRNEYMRLFAAVGGYGPAYAKIYYIKFLENNIPVVDLIPVRKGNVGYMYDKISGKLYGNSGSGTFTLGADILNKYDSQIEYLESDGYAYIDLDYIPNTNTKVDLKFRPITNELALSVGFLPIGGRVNYQDKNFVLMAPVNNNTDLYLCLGNTSTKVTLTNLLDADHTIVFEQNNSTFTFNNTQYSCSGNGAFTYTIPLRIFTCNLNNNIPSSKFNKIRIYYLKIYEGSTLIYDFIPVRKNGVGYLYDKISKKLFGNCNNVNSNSAFILGADL